MVKEWATVIHWYQGRALLRYSASVGCGSCSARATCGSYALNKIGPDVEHQLELDIEQPLQVGQKVEIGIPEASLLRSAMLVYLSPLIGLFLLSAISQFYGLDQLWVFVTGVSGGIAGFLFAKKIAQYWGNNSAFQPVILQIGPQVDTRLIQLER